MLKIAVVTDYCPTSAQPWAGHSAYQTLRLLARQCDVRVFYPEATYPAWLQRRMGLPKILDRTWNPDDLKVTYIPYPTVPVLARPLNGFISARRLLPYVRDYQPDLILNYAVYPYGLAAVKIARKLGVPAVVTAIGSDLNRMSDPICALLTRSTLRHADYVTTVSHDLMVTAHQMGAPPETMSAILNGCNTGIFYPQDRTSARAQLGLQHDAEIAVYVGRLDVRKGLIELIEACAALHQTRPRFHCYVVGDGPDKALLEQTIAQQNAAAAVTLIPSCPTDRVALWMAAANLVTLPSYAEGCPNVVIEALSAGRPVVATRVGGIPELMDDACGQLVPPGNVEALTSALDHVLSREWNAEEISARHSRSWTDVMHELHHLFQELTDGH
jgi:teichuronic acid biosynthesis glycosyltransferase TuaC